MSSLSKLIPNRGQCSWCLYGSRVLKTGQKYVDNNNSARRFALHVPEHTLKPQLEHCYRNRETDQWNRTGISELDSKYISELDIW